MFLLYSCACAPLLLPRAARGPNHCIGPEFNKEDSLHLGVFFTLKQPFVRELLKPGWPSSTTAATRIVAGLPLCVAWCWAEDLALATASAKPMRQAIVLLKTSSTFQRDGIPICEFPGWFASPIVDSVSFMIVYSFARPLAHALIAAPKDTSHGKNPW